MGENKGEDKMTDYEKMQQILCVLMKICRSRDVVLTTAETALERCGDSEMIDFYYRRLCKDVR